MHAFKRYLRGLLGAYVQVERGGPEACQGRLARIADDYMTLWPAEGGELHLPLHHIHSVTSLAMPEDGLPSPALEGADPPATFAELLSMNHGQYIRLNHAGPELSIGILRDVTEDCLLMEVSPGETACFPLFHIRSLCVAPALSEPPELPGETAEPLQGR